MLTRILKFFDDFNLAARGFLLAFSRRKFRIIFVVIFVAFSLLLNLLTNGLSSFRLIFSGSPVLAFGVLRTAFLGTFGIGKNFLDFILNFLLSLLQAGLLSLVIFVYQHNKKTNSARQKHSPKASESGQDSSASSGFETSAIVAGLALLGSGCPTCGTTLLAPILSTFLSGVAGGVALAGKLAALFNIFAFLLGLLAFRKLGLETYAIIKSEKFMNRKKKEDLNYESRS